MASRMGLGTTSTSSSASANTTLFRRLIWEGHVPVEISISDKELPADSDRGLLGYFVQIPRVAYLPFVIPEIRQYLAEAVLSEREVGSINEEQWWFEDEFGGVVKTHWTVGLLYDLYVASKTMALAALTPPATGASPLIGFGPNAVPLVHPQPAHPLRLILHLTSPPADKLFSPPTQEACKQAFMAQLKEADFLRWGSTKRVTGLRKAEQDGIWDALKEHNFDDFWRVASKITPTPSPLPNQTQSTFSTSVSSTAGHSRPPSVDPSSTPNPNQDAINTVRAVPIRIYLPDSPPSSSLSNLPAPPAGNLTSLTLSISAYVSTLPGTTTSTVIQPLVQPNLEAASSIAGSVPGSPASTFSVPNAPTPPPKPATLRTLLSSQLPLLFPSNIGAEAKAYAIVHGVVVPEDAELGWLGGCMAGADGWVCVVIGLGKGV